MDPVPFRRGENAEAALSAKQSEARDAEATSAGWGISSRTPRRKGALTRESPREDARGAIPLSPPAAPENAPTSNRRSDLGNLESEFLAADAAGRR